MFFNCRNGQGHFVRYFQHRFFVNTSQDEDAAALRRQRLDDRLDLAQRFAGVQLRFDVVLAAQQLQVGDRLETHHLVAAGGVDDQIAGDGEEIGAAGGDIFPVIGGIGAGQDLGDHVLQFVGGRQYPPEPAAQGRLLRQYHRLEPFQFGANPLHMDPLIIVSRASPAFFYLS